MWDRRARVQRVIDGDTLEVVLDQGFGDTKRIIVRLKDCHAPERGQEGYKETKRYLTDWCIAASSGTRTWPFIVTTYRTQSDVEDMTFNRYVAELLSTDDTGRPIGRASTAVNDYVSSHAYPPGRRWERDG